MLASPKKHLHQDSNATMLNPNLYPPMIMKNRLISLLAIALGEASLASCLPLAAGVAGGYVAHKEGYRVQNPIYKR